MNTTEPSVCGGDAALCQITLTAYLYITVTVQLTHSCLLTVTWTVLSRRVADARAAASDTQHCWGHVCLPPLVTQLNFCAVRYPSSSVLTYAQPTVVT